MKFKYHLFKFLTCSFFMNTANFVNKKFSEIDFKDYLAKILKLKDKNTGEPKICLHCGNTEFVERTTVSINSITCESNVRCLICDFLWGVYLYGNYFWY